MEIATARRSPAPAGKAMLFNDDRLAGFAGDKLRGCITDKALSRTRLSPSMSQRLWLSS
jgi:hypothetical protein